MAIREFLENRRVEEAGEEIKNAGKLILELFESPDKFFGAPNEAEEEVAPVKEVVTEREKMEAITVHAEKVEVVGGWKCPVCRDEGRLGNPGHYVPCPSAVHGKGT